MKISAPISDIREIKPIAAAGADEIYFGYVPEEWQKNFGEVPLNRRIFGNLYSLRELQIAVETVHASGKTVSLTLNQQQYTAEQIDCLLRAVDLFAEAGGDSIIVSDIGLMVSILYGELYIPIS